MENNKENREKLSSVIVEGWDLGSLIDYAAQALESDMEEWGNVEFEEEWGFYMAD